MVTKNVILKNQKEIVEFVDLVEQYPYVIDISVGHYTIDAKSILGMIGLGFNRVMKMDIYAEKADDLLKSVDRFIYRELGKVI